MKNKIKQISFLLLIITTVFANYRLISSKDGLTDTVLSSLIITSAAAGESGMGPYLEEYCAPCPNDLGQTGAQWSCVLTPNYATCTFIQSCQYGVC